MSYPSLMDVIALAFLVLSTTMSMLMVPDVRGTDLLEPTIQAVILTPFVLTAILAFRIAGTPPVWERRLLALFLLSMPTVYLGSLALHGGSPAWLAIEIGGQVAFAALALAGLRGSGWVLVFGLAAHGLLWDLWHHGRTPFMPDWYATGCLIVDIGWAVYAASRVKVWQSSAIERSAPARVPVAIVPQTPASQQRSGSAGAG
jgi:hypothetical protein